jgi:hypothetical protein
MIPGSRRRDKEDLQTMPAIRLYRWKIQYARNFATKWLEAVASEAERRAMDEYERNGTPPLRGAVLSRFREYQAYQQSHGATQFGDLYFVIEDVGVFAGWGVFRLPSADQALAIQVNGREDSDGNMVMDFSQPPGKVIVLDPNGQRVQWGTPAYNLKVTFSKANGSGAGTNLTGQLHHPIVETVVIGETELYLRLFDGAARPLPSHSPEPQPQAPVNDRRTRARSGGPKRT